MHAITGKPILQKLHVHTGDQVIVIAGANKGVISEVTYVRAPAACARAPIWLRVWPRHTPLTRRCAPAR